MKEKRYKQILFSSWAMEMGF